VWVAGVGPRAAWYNLRDGEHGSIQGSELVRTLDAVGFDLADRLRATADVDDPRGGGEAGAAPWCGVYR